MKISQQMRLVEYLSIYEANYDAFDDEVAKRRLIGVDSHSIALCFGYKNR